jgi:hypothetical protein
MFGQRSTGTLTANASTYVMPAPSAGKGRWIAALVAVAVLAGVAGRWFSEPGEPARAPSSAATLAVVTAASHTSEPVKPQPVMTLKVAATPFDSEILLDGATLEGNPFSGEFPKDAALRRLEVRCLGRVTEARMIRMDQDLDLLIALQVDRSTRLLQVGASASAGKKAASSKLARSASAAAAAAGSASAAPVNPQGTPSGADVRPSDDSDPNGK